MGRQSNFGSHNPEIAAHAREQRLKSFAERHERSRQGVFVVRLPSPSKGYAWEIRRFGNIVLSRGEAEYPTPAAAQSAGEVLMAQEATTVPSKGDPDDGTVGQALPLSTTCRQHSITKGG